jgi:hypothetical protein
MVVVKVKLLVVVTQFHLGVYLKSAPVRKKQVIL